MSQHERRPGSSGVSSGFGSGFSFADARDIGGGTPAATSILDGLNDAQREAVTHDSGALMVIAGAGSGKTRVLTHRIAYLMHHVGISPYEILAITFTNKAANEMKDRVRELVGPVADQMWVATFHSACVRILRANADKLGYPRNFTIYDQSDSSRMVGYVIRDMELDAKRFPARSVHSLISSIKNDGHTPEEYSAQVAEDRSGSFHDEQIAKIYAEYQQRLKLAGAMDFDDLLGKVVELFKSFPAVLEQYQRRFKHILVDEYQDTNSVQNELVLLLGENHSNVCVVGDTDQSIYMFRGASVANMLDFEHAFPDAQVILLEQNYRSTQNILDAANAVISQNVGRQPKHLWTDQGTGDPIVYFRGQDERDEALWVAKEIMRAHETGPRPWSEMAILYRTNAQSRVLEDQFTRLGIPYRMVGGTRFLDRKENKDVIAYLRAVMNPLDEVSLKRVINVPKRGVGDQTIAKLDMFAMSHGVAFIEAMRRWFDAEISPRSARGVETMLSILDEASDLTEEPPAELLEHLLERSGYLSELEAHAATGGPAGLDAQIRIDNLHELVGMASEFDTIEEFLEQVSLVSEGEDADTNTNGTSKVTMMTLHAAKGLEFPVVFLVGMEDGIFPHARTFSAPDELEEERRLCYVGITRAREELFLSSAWQRTLFGRSEAYPPSRFLDEIPEEVIQVSEHSSRGGQASRYRQRSWDDTAWGDTSWGDSSYDSYGDSSSRGSSYSSTRRSRPAHVDQRGPAAIDRRKPAAPTPTHANELGLVVGDDVRHNVWGDGVILQIIGAGESAEAVVNFPSVGEKRLLLTWAPIEKVSK